jgi:hypothetical protein
METKLTIEITVKDGQLVRGGALHMPFLTVSVDGKSIDCLQHLRLVASGSSPGLPNIEFSVDRVPFALAPEEEAPVGWDRVLEKIAEEDKLLQPFLQELKAVTQ